MILTVSFFHVVKPVVTIILDNEYTIITFSLLAVKEENVMEKPVILQAVYKQLYNKDFAFANFSERMQVQKTTYLLQEMGLNFGDYGFRWYKHGPYSQAVHDDSFYIVANSQKIQVESSNIKFKDFANNLILKFKELFIDTKTADYDFPTWLEAVASIHYLMKYKLLTKDCTKVLDELRRVKEHLNNQAANKEAWNVASRIL